MANELNQNVSMDDLLDGTLDDLADMPEFKPFASGAHKLKLNFDATKKVNDMPAIEVKLTCIESVELSPTHDTQGEEIAPPAPGDTTNVLFILKKKDESGKVVRNELAEGQFKKLMQDLQPMFPEATNARAIMEAAEGYEVLGVTSQRVNKKDPKNVKVYTSLDSVMSLD